MPRRSLIQLWRDEFTDYSAATLRADVIAGVNVAAVALPLALAFGVASGSTASAGLITAILAGFVAGALAGAPYQISGPTGAMSAVLVSLGQRYGLPAIWTAGVMAGALLLVIGIFRFGRFIAFVPAPVTTGFTSGIALIIAIGQIDNFLGVQTPPASTAAFKLLGYLNGGVIPDVRAVMLGLLVIITMIVWRPDWNRRLPASLLGIALATVASLLLGWDVKTIGTIPTTLVLEPRLTLGNIPFNNLSELVMPALTVTALGALVSLMCGASASNLSGTRMQVNQELIAQGVSNMIYPFFGGVPATGAVARTLVGIRSGGRTRVVSFVHSVVLLLFMWLFGVWLARVPLAALAGVLFVTVWRMNEWHNIRYFIEHRFKTALITFAVTVLAATFLDLAQTILLSVFLSGAAFLNQIASLTIEVQDVDPNRMRQRGIEFAGNCPHIKVAYLTGPLFFAATGSFNEAFAKLSPTQTLIFSLRGMPLIDTSGLQVLMKLCQRIQNDGGTVMIAGAHDSVKQMLERGGLTEMIGTQNFFWSADQAIVAAENRTCGLCDPSQSSQLHVNA